MIDLRAFGRLTDTAPIQWEMLKTWANYQMAQTLAKWGMNPDALEVRK